MLQIVLKSYNYYDGNIDGDIGPVSKTALINFQNNNDLDDDGILGCLLYTSPSPRDRH